MLCCGQLNPAFHIVLNSQAAPGLQGSLKLFPSLPSCPHLILASSQLLINSSQLSQVPSVQDPDWMPMLSASAQTVWPRAQETIQTEGRHWDLNAELGMGTRGDQNAWLKLWDVGNHLFSACPCPFGLSTAGIDGTYYFPHKNLWEHLEESGIGILETHIISTFERHIPSKWPKETL